MSLLIFFFAFSVFAQEGYPPESIKITHEILKRAVIKNNSCFPVLVFVNNQDLSVKAGEEVGLGSDQWGQWKWTPGTIGNMNERTIPSPIKEKNIPDFGPDTGDSHSGDYKFSYDFTVPQGTKVYAMESGVVVRVVQHYTVPHQNKALMDQVNKVEILHGDGSIGSYVHLKPQSVSLRLCESVSPGTLIGLSGHNGYSTGPHLHVDITRPVGRGKFMSIPLKFLSK